MVNDDLYTVTFVIAVYLFIGWQDEFPEHIRREKQGCIGTPIVVVEKRIRLEVFGNFFGIGKLVLGYIIDKLMGFFGVFIKVYKAFGYALKVMKLLKNTGKEAKAGILFIPVYGFYLLNAVLPVGSWVMGFRRMYHVPPCGDVLYHFVGIIVQWHRPWLALNPAYCYPPKALAFTAYGRKRWRRSCYRINGIKKIEKFV
jgi:hypothetical protein